MALASVNVAAANEPKAIARNTKLSTMDPTPFDAITARPKRRRSRVYTPMSKSSAIRNADPDANATAGLSQALSRRSEEHCNDAGSDPRASLQCVPESERGASCQDTTRRDHAWSDWHRPYAFDGLATDVEQQPVRREDR